MEIERAIEVLKEYNNCKAVLTEELEDATDLAIQALEKQTGKKVVCETVDERGVEYEFIHFRCPNCRNIVHQQYKHAKAIAPYRQNYCVDCGQRMNWGDEQ